MEYKYKFSIIIAVYNVEKYINETINSILNQSLNFEENIQLILVDDGSTDNSLQIIKDYEEKYPNNIIVISKENGGQSTARNKGLEFVEAKYVNFLDSDDYISKDTLENVYTFFEKHQQEIDVVAIPMTLFERVNLPHRLNSKFNKTRIINLIDEPNNPQLSSSSAFIKSSVMKNYSFSTKLVNLEDALIINKIFLDKKKYGVLNNAEYFYRQRLDNSSTVDQMDTKKEYYTPRLENFYIHLINHCLDNEGCVPKFIQYLFAYDLQWLLKVNSLDIFENDDELNDFWNKLNYIISYIDMDCIVNNEHIDEHIESFFVYLKNNQQLKLESSDNDIYIKSKDYIVDKLSSIVLWFDIIELKDDYLSFSGNIESNFFDDYLDIKLIKQSSGNKQVIDTKLVKYNNIKRQTLKYLSINWKYNYNFDAKCKVSLNDKIYFQIQYNDGINTEKTIPHISFRESCGLSTSSAYFVKDSKIILFKNNKLNILPYSYKSMIRYEISNIRRINTDKEPYYKYAIIMRIIYFILYPLMKNKKIWLYSDRPDFADDNAKSLYKYSITKKDNINKYFIVSKNSPSYSIMKKQYPNIVAFGSIKHKVLYLFASKVISSYVNENFINPYHYMTPSLYSGLITSNRYFLQHGVTKDNVSEFIKKYDKNLSLIVCVSELEHDSFLLEGYNFDKKVIQTLGFPRYDYLENKSEKQILFAPTWRLELSNKKRLIQSKYYNTLNEFLNNAKLKDILDKYDYKLVFKAHPELEKYIDLIKIPEYVEVSQNVSYNQLFKESSLLITDYSSVYFDFAYLKKPVIYYQKDDDYHYSQGYYNYETMGFGPVIKSPNDLINQIHDYLDNDCMMPEKYNKRVDSFFKHNDKNNCKRVYEWILND